MEEKYELLKKSDELFVKFKDEGNQKFRESDFVESLILYNKALCYAESKENQALAYANRSAAYMELEKFDESLLNIQWARENYPADKIQKLNEREEKCKKKKEEQVIDPEDDPWNFFKLSYPANPKIPFIIDNMVMKTTVKFGRGIYTNRNLNPGDIIALEDCQIRLISLRAEVLNERYMYCCNCVKANMLNLVPCTKSSSLMFCSVSCREITYKRIPNLNKIFIGPASKNFDKMYADIEEILGNRDNVSKFIKEFDYKKSKVTIFDFDLSDATHPDYRKNLLKCFLTFTSSYDVMDPYFLSLMNVKIELSKEIEEFTDFIYDVSGAFNLDAMTLDFAAMTTTFGGLLNHSCMPNVDRVQVANKIAFYIVRPVKVGEQLFESYAVDAFKNIANYYNLLKRDRILMLSHIFRFTCECPACKRDLNQAFLINFHNDYVDKRASDSFLALKSSVKKTSKELKKNWKYVSEHHKQFLSRSVPFLITFNKTMIWQIARAASYPTFRTEINAPDFLIV